MKEFLGAAVFMQVLCAAAAAQVVTSGNTLTFTIAPADQCSIAEISIEGEVTIDWKCVELKSEHWREGKASDGIFPVLAHVMKAIRDGSAKSKGEAHE